QFTLPGFPCVYYGDEAGMEGYRDPFNRCCYPWGREDKEMVEYHSRLGKLRASCSALWDGDFINAYAQGKRLAYVRYDHETAIYCVYNMSEEEMVLDTPPGYSNARAFFGSRLENHKLYLKPVSCEFLITDL
ncbi:MAG: glycoside hydrolase family 13 protein, partial [Ruminococcus sp.]|nr:glycoside hydrolase family 13 protein [Ruminococcus sp.]